MGLARIGPVEVEHGNPAFGWDGGSEGVQSGSISGFVTWNQAKQLREMVTNPDRRMTVGARSGVMEYVHFDDLYLDDLCGWYLLESFSLQPSQEHSLSDYTAPFSLSAAYLGDGVEVVVTHSWRQIPNSHGLVGRPAVYDPFTGNELVVSSSIAGFLREADEVLPHDISRDSVPLT